MKPDKSLLAVLSIFLILLVFVSSASAADSNATDVLSVDESVNLENNTLALDAASSDNNVLENDNGITNNENNLMMKEATYQDFMNQVRSGGAVTLQKALYKYNGAGEQITIMSDLTLDGDGSILDMSGSDFSIFYSVAVGKTITIKNLIIKNAKSSTSSPFNIEKGSFIIENCIVENCSGKGGGAFRLYDSQGEHVIRNCTFVNNHATGEGGVFYFQGAKPTIENCAFFNNVADNGGDVMRGIQNKPADNNWWGLNNPIFSKLIKSGREPNSWAILNGATDTETIAPGSKAKLTYTFNDIYTSALLSSIPVRPIELSTTTGGQLDNTSGYLVNGEFSTEFTSNTPGDYTITAIVDGQTITTTITVTGGPTPVTNTWYVDASAPSGGNGSKENPFKDLLSAVEKTSDGDTIIVAPGTYSGERNRAYIYSNNLNIIKDGDGEAIFDSGKQYRILTIFVPTINIDGLTFKNGKIDKWGVEEDGGAIRFNNSITNSNINAKFIDNFAVMNGGAIYFSGDVTNTNINIESINNDAGNQAGALFFKGKVNNVNLTGKVMDSNITWSSGGAVFFNDTVSNLIVNAIFSGNVAEWNGGAIRFEKNVNNVTVDGNYTNNKAQYGAALSFGGESDNVNIFGYYYANNANITNIIELNNIVRNSFFNGVFINNSADNGSSGIFLYKSVSDCTFSGVFINNAAINGAALFYCEDVNNTIIKNAVFLNNKAISDSVSLTENDGIVEIKFYGAHDFLNAIWSSNDLSFDNVTYWGENGIMNTGTKTITHSQLEAGQNITITINNTGVITQKTMQTDANGTITLDLRNDRGKYIITAYHPEDAYYTESNHTSINFTIDKQSSTIDLSTEKKIKLLLMLLLVLQVM